MTRRRTAWILAVMVGAAFSGLVLSPSPIDPAAYVPTAAPPLEGALAPNDLLSRADLLLAGAVQGPEDVAFDAEGRLYAGTSDGKIVRLSLAGALEVVATTGGRPLGLRFDGKGRLIVCDSYKGLLSIEPSGRITVLATEADGGPFHFTNNLDVAGDDVIYFTDASSSFGQTDYLYDLLEARPHGRLLRYEPGTRRVSVLLRDLYFANGVALSKDEDFVLVNETYRYRIRRLWLKGPKAGTADIFFDNLPGFPDNLDRSPRGTFWLALFTVRNPIVDALHPHPWAKRLLAKLPRPLWPKPEPYGLVLELDPAARVLRSLHDPVGRRISQVTAAREHDGHLYLGTLDKDAIGRVPVPGR